MLATLCGASMIYVRRFGIYIILGPSVRTMLYPYSGGHHISIWQEGDLVLEEQVEPASELTCYPVPSRGRVPPIGRDLSWRGVCPAVGVGLAVASSVP